MLLISRGQKGKHHLYSLEANRHHQTLTPTPAAVVSPSQRVRFLFVRRLLHFVFHIKKKLKSAHTWQVSELE